MERIKMSKTRQELERAVSGHNLYAPQLQQELSGHDLDEKRQEEIEGELRYSDALLPKLQAALKTPPTRSDGKIDIELTRGEEKLREKWELLDVQREHGEVVESLGKPENSQRLAELQDRRRSLKARMEQLKPQTSPWD